MNNFITSIRPKRQLNLLIAGVFVALQFTLALSIVNSVSADGNGSPEACLEQGNTNVIGSVEGSADSVTKDVGTGKIVTGVCIKSGEGMFSGVTHSGVLGNGTYENGCYTVAGVGTQSVTVTRLLDTNECKGISHIDVVTGTATNEEPVLIQVCVLSSGLVITIDEEDFNATTQSKNLTLCDEEENKVTLCHATGSETNPFVKITVAAAGAFNGHLGNDHQNGEDIIPPFEFDGQTYSQNWDTEGQALYRNDCVAEDEEDEDDGEILGTTTTQQATPAVGGVSAGSGGGASSIITSAFGLVASLGAVGYGAVNFLRRKS